MTGGTLHVTCDGVIRVLTPDRSWSIGRDAGCDVPVDHATVSRHHALVRWDPASDRWLLEDDGSRNGLFLAGQRVPRVVVGGPIDVVLGAPVDGAVLHLEPTTRERTVPPPPPGAAPAVLRIGRAADNDIVVDDLLVSRHHAELRRAPDGTRTLVDLDSHNGTFVNGRRSDRVALDDRDLVAIGGRLFRLGPTGLEAAATERGRVAFAARDITVQVESGKVIVDDVSLALEEHGLLAVVGPSGCGKSTLLAALTGARHATQGQVLYGDRDLYADYDELQHRIGIVPQDDVLHTDLTVRHTLDYTARLRFPPDVSADERRHRVDEVLAELGLSQRADTLVRKLSGGQRKRVSVALELLTRPSLLFLDEPTSGLDPGYERALMQLLRQLADGGRTVVVVTHAVQSLKLCDRVLLLAPGGSTAYYGPPQLAASHFGKADLESVFQMLSAGDGTDWKQRFVQHPDHDQYVRQPLAARLAPIAAEARPRPTPNQRMGTWWTQFSVLVARYAAVLRADRRTLALLLFQAPLIGLLMLYAMPSGQLEDVEEVRLLSTAATVIYYVVVASGWLGASLAAREIVKERPIFRRERAVGLSVSAYLASKVVVLGVVTVIQSVVLVAVAFARQGGPEEAVLLGWGLGEAMVGVAAGALAAMALGLLLSSVARSSDMALTVLPIVLIFQNVLAVGGSFPQVIDKPVLEQLSYVASTQWSFAAVASTADLNELQRATDALRGLSEIDLGDPVAVADRLARPSGGSERFDHEAGAWLVDIAAVTALAAALLIATWLVLSRRTEERR